MDLIIRHVFDNIAHFEYNQAHRHVQRLIKVHSQLNIPTHFCTILTKLIQYESMFTDLSFSKPKLVFGREDLDDLYRVLMNDADKDKVSYPQHMASQSPLPSTELQLERTVSTSSFSSARLGPKEFAATTNWEFLSHVQEMVCEVVRTRRRLIRIYRQFAKCNIPDELNALLDSVVDIHGRVDIEAISALSEVFSESIRKEYAVLINLLKCHQATTQYRFKDASQYLYLGRFELIAWKKLCFPNDYHERTFKSHFKSLLTHSPVPSYMAWMYKLSESVNVKMTFYFYSILQKTATMEQSKLNFSGIDTATSKLNPNIFDVIKDFVKQSRAFNVSLMFQVDKSIPFHIDGYSCAELAESYDGLNSYPTIYSYPNLSTPSEHLPNIVSLILSSISSQSPVLELGSCIQFYDNKVESSYFVLKLDAQVLLTVIYKEKRNPKCQVTLDFLELVQDCVWLRSAIDDLNERF